MKVLKWLFVVLVLGFTVWLTSAWFYSMAVDVTYSLRGLPLSEGLTSFIVNTAFVSLYVLLFWFLAGALDLLPTIREFIAEYNIWIFLLVWLGGSALVLVAIILAVLAFFAYLFFLAIKDDQESRSYSGGGSGSYGGGYDPNANRNLRDEANRKRDEIDRINRGFMRDQDIAASVGNRDEADRLQNQINYNNRQV